MKSTYAVIFFTGLLLFLHIYLCIWRVHISFSQEVDLWLWSRCCQHTLTALRNFLSTNEWQKLYIFIRNKSSWNFLTQEMTYKIWFFTILWIFLIINFFSPLINMIKTNLSKNKQKASSLSSLLPSMPNFKEKREKKIKFHFLFFHLI